MAITIASILSLIPTNVWGMIKKFVKTEELKTFDTPFKMSTKYTPALLVIAVCLSFGNQFFRAIEMDCVSGSRGSGEYSGGSSGKVDEELNNYCWNSETFLVAKALTPAYRGRVSYPGIWSYNRGEDELVHQRYYKFLWFGFGAMAALAFIPLFIWKFKGGAKIRPIMSSAIGTDGDENEEARVWAANFIEIINFNKGYGLFYFFCKTLATITPIVHWVFFRSFVGKGYSRYGIDYLTYSLDGGDPWPNPMDALFPKIAKCEWARYGFTGDMEVKAAQCQLPMNNVTQWSFFVLWWWTALVLLVNLGSYFYFTLMLVCPCLRQSIYRSYVTRVCREDVDRARNYMGQGQRSPRHFITVQLGFGDWLVLYFLEANLEGFHFRNFIRMLALTSNTAVQLKPIQQKEVNLPAAPPPEGEDGEFYTVPVDDTRAPPAYTPIANGGTERHAADPKMGFTFEQAALPFVIRPPIKLERGPRAGTSSAKKPASTVQKKETPTPAIIDLDNNWD